jgi:hypothetical protein
MSNAAHIYTIQTDRQRSRQTYPSGNRPTDKQTNRQACPSGNRVACYIIYTHAHRWSFISLAYKLLLTVAGSVEVQFVTHDSYERRDICRTLLQSCRDSRER